MASALEQFVNSVRQLSAQGEALGRRTGHGRVPEAGLDPQAPARTAGTALLVLRLFSGAGLGVAAFRSGKDRVRPSFGGVTSARSHLGRLLVPSVSLAFGDWRTAMSSLPPLRRLLTRPPEAGGSPFWVPWLCGSPRPAPPLPGGARSGTCAPILVLQNAAEALARQMTQLCELINKSGELLAKNLSHLDTVLGALDVQEHSLGVLAVLFVKFSMPSVPDFETLFSQVQLFISTCNGEHIRYATDTFAGLCHQLTNALVERKQPLRGIGILKQAIDKMQMNTNQLTSIHADLCQLCLLAKCFKPALPYLDVDMMDICKENGAYDAKHFLCYYYYGGMIYTGLKNFERALYFYEQAITTPAMAVSHIMLESYKKYILVSLILLGKVQQLPKYTSQIVGRFIKPLSNAYHELAQVYSTNNPSELRNLVNKHSETFTRDNNMGLVKQCLSSLYKKNIQRLTKTFLTLSLQDMASRVQLSGPQEAEKYVLHM
ncbi:COP9 signalosome complex subunit 3, partial [Hylobates moloch]|uniref:COP9 signalosome complex subunit 3 n=1 Tax=Hylobates moloch TaxID=81572 RepID=UPI00267665E8